MNRESYPESYVSVKNICPNWVTNNFLEFMDLKLEDLKGKNITSVGWWFWIFEMDAAKQGAKVTIVDPMFMDENYADSKLQGNIDWMEDKIRRQGKGILEWIKSNVARALNESNDEKDRSRHEEKLNWYNDLQVEKDKYSDRHKELLNHLKSRKENQKKYWLILNGSSWDKIEWIGIDSQDMVIIAHTLSHIYNNTSCDIVEFLLESLKLLKPGWKLYIVDYVGDMGGVENVLEKTDCKKYYKVNKWSFVCCFDKKGLSKFIENERG